MARLTTRGPATAEAIAARDPFTTSGAMRGVTRYEGRGICPVDVPFDADYYVYSYATPIAWHTDEGWTVPAVKYSITTTKHQSNLYLVKPANAPRADKVPASTGGVWAG